MTLEAYDLCPGGTGNRIKRCQCRDILADLNQILRALEGGQRVAALDQINRLLATRANRACLLALKCSALLKGNQLQELEETVLTFLRIAPENTLALAYATILNAIKGDTGSAVQTLQKALANTHDRMPFEVYEAIDIVGQVLVRSGEYVAGRGHFVLQASITKDEDSVRRLLELSRNPRIPTLFKQDFIHAPCPDDFRWKSEFDAANELVLRGAWQAACAQFDTIAAQAPEEPCVLRSIAICRSLLGDRQAAAAWHCYAALDGIDEEEAVEAEAFAQLLAGRAEQDVVSIVRTTLLVADPDAAMEKLLSAPVTVSTSADKEEMDDPDSPPPKGVFLLLEHPAPDADGMDGTLPPAILGRILLFGKETDRAARIECLFPKSDSYDQLLQSVKDIVGQLGAPEDEQVIGAIPALRSAFVGGLFFPPTADGSVLKKLTGLQHEKLGQIIIQRWPELPCVALDGKRPSEVAADPTYRVRLLGALLALQQLMPLYGWPDVTDQLRERLGLPKLAEIEPNTTTFDQLPLVRHGRMRVSALPDPQLVRFFERAQMYGLDRVMAASAREILGRESLKGKVDRATLFGLLANITDDIALKLDYLLEARSAASARGNSPAQWLLAELPIRLQYGDSQEAQRILRQLQARHLNEPGVAEAIHELFKQLGIATDAASGGTAAAPPETPEDADTTGKLWTPDTPAPADAPAATPTEHAAEPKSKLWVPGQD